MRIALVGKGGSGKSAIVGTLARVLAGRGEPVLVLDSDPMPGLALSLGMEVTDAGIPDDAVEEGPEDAPRFVLREPVVDTVERYARTGPDGVRLIELGKLRGHVSALGRSQFAFREIVRGLVGLPDVDMPWHVIGDLPGGTRQPYFGWGRYARTALVVVEPTAKSALSARRLARLRDGEDAPALVAVANKIRGEDPDELGRRVGLDVVAVVPWDETFAQAERLGRAPIDHDPDSPAVRAVVDLAARLRDEHGAPGPAVTVAE